MSTLEKDLVKKVIEEGRKEIEVEDKKYEIKDKVPDNVMYLSDIRFEKTPRIRVVIQKIDMAKRFLKRLENVEELYKKMAELGIEIKIEKDWNSNNRVGLFATRIELGEKLYDELGEKDWKEVVEAIKRKIEDELQQWVEWGNKLVDNELYRIEEIKEEEDEWDP